MICLRGPGVIIDSPASTQAVSLSNILSLQACLFLVLFQGLLYVFLFEPLYERSEGPTNLLIEALTLELKSKIVNQRFYFRYKLFVCRTKVSINSTKGCVQKEQTMAEQGPLEFSVG